MRDRVHKIKASAMRMPFMKFLAECLTLFGDETKLRL